MDDEKLNNSQTTSREESITRWDSFIRLGPLTLYLLIWIIDSFFLKATTFLTDEIHLVVRLTLSIIVLILGKNISG